ncbi:C40 family peptidase [Mycobacteroides abscessus]|uniref:C40 family peptidase n=1 Tax=Mycobacteroides abscessus TaxID=36809 RepID=UPI0019CF6733|nr:NlpC/P60 family protein [Mycobacteroides abscessus]MBN7560313.1 C40 family peptidase [Mycobacteroides abscessus subsp. abscessus]
MAKIGDIRHWKVETLEKLFDTASAKAASLHRLGEGMDQVANDLSTWGGVTADAWRDSAGKTRVDLGDKADAAEKVAKAVKPAIDDVRDVTNKLGILDQEAQSFGLKITDDGKVVAAVQVKDTDKYTQDQHIAALQKQVTALEQRATGVEQEIAAALRADVTDAPAPTPGPSPLRDVGSQERPGVTDINDPDVQWQPGIDPAKWKESYRNPQLSDNPPGMTLPAGAERDAAWREYLANYPKDGTRGVLPNPDAVQDKGLKNLGFAATQLGTSYAWSGGDTKGPGKGSFNYDKNGNLIPDESYTYNDPKRVGFDCSGLTEYAAGQVIGGNDNSVGGYTGTQLGSPKLADVASPGHPGTPQPGDLVFYGPGTAEHVGIYVSDGVIINAPGSGIPVQINLRGTTPDVPHGEYIRVRGFR